MSIMISHWNRNINFLKKQLGENLTERHFFSFHFANNVSQNMTKEIINPPLLYCVLPVKPGFHYDA